MTTVIMMLMFPMGLYTYLVIEKRVRREYQEVFDAFEYKTASNPSLNSSQKVELFEQMLMKNGYEVVSVDASHVVGEKKVLSMAWMMMGLGIYIIGLFFYLAYYFWFQKPHRVEFVL